MGAKGYDCFRNNIIPKFDFLHKNHIYETQKKTIYSKTGIFFSMLLIIIFILLFFHEINESRNNPSVKYSQDFIKLKNWAGKKITIGFNVSEEWKNEMIFTLFNSFNEVIPLKKCNSNLEESENFTCFCIIDYIINTNNNNIFSTHILKIHLNKTNDINNTLYKIPFSISIREPIIDHNNYESPLDITDNNSINKFKCSFYTNEITSYRRDLKLIFYETYGGFNYNDKNDSAIYLDDFEDSRKGIRTTELNFIGSYRIVLSKKVDVYEKKYNDFLTIISKVGGYTTPVNVIFSILFFVFVLPLDNIRIYKSLKNDDLIEKIYNDKIKDNKKYRKDFENIESFKNKLNDNNIWNKIKNHILFIFCYCCYYNKNTKHLYIMKEYFDDKQSLENELNDTQRVNKNYENEDNIIDRDVEMNIFGNKFEDSLIIHKKDNLDSQIS